MKSLLVACSGRRGGAERATYYVTVAGLGGEPEYEQRFSGWAKDIEKALKSAPDSHAETLYGEAATRAAIRAAFDRIAKQAKPADSLVVMLIGHGSFDGSDYKINLPGPDLSAIELASLLDRLPPTRQLVVNMTSASGGAIDALRKEGRVIVSATKTGTEKNATVFARYWAEALHDPAADADKNETISALEAFQVRRSKDRAFLHDAEAHRHRTRDARRYRQGRGRARAVDREWRGDAGVGVSITAAGFERQRGQGSGQVEAVDAERGAGAADRPSEVSEGGHADRGLSEHNAFNGRAAAMGLLAEDAGGVGPMRPASWRDGRLGLLRAFCGLGLLLVSSAYAQTIERAEALWRAQQYKEAGAAFEALVKRNDKNADYKVRYGRLLLERFNPDQAAGLFQEALEIKKDHAGALLGLALVAADGFEGKAAALARAALDADPQLLEAQELLARLALEDNNPAKAIEEADKALKISAKSLDAMAIRATIDLLDDKTDSPWLGRILAIDPKYGEAYSTIAYFFVLNRRYEEGIEFYRKAIELKPDLWSARSQLGINLMRLGEEQEALVELETAFNNGFKDKPTTNTLNLMDSYKNFVTFKTDNTILKLHKKEAELLRPYFEAGAEARHRDLREEVQDEARPPGAGRSLSGPRRFRRPHHGDAGPGRARRDVRLRGRHGQPVGPQAGQLPLGQHHVARVEPRLRALGDQAQGAALVHRRAGGARGDGGCSRLGRPARPAGDHGAIKDKKLLPVAELDRGFIHPSYPAQVIVSYFQAGRICDYINKKWGYDKLLDMMHDFGTGMPTPEVIEKELGLKPEEFDKKFLASLTEETKKTVDGFDAWVKKMKEINELAKANKHDEVIAEASAIRDVYPDYVEIGSVYEFLYDAYLAKNDKAHATAELERYSQVGGRDPGLIKKLATLLEEAGRKPEAAAALTRLNWIYPEDEELHRRLGELDFGQGKLDAAAEEFRAAIAMKPLDNATAHYNLARAYRSSGKDNDARDELLLALETAPGFRPAQKMLLELSKEEIKK